MQSRQLNQVTQEGNGIFTFLLLLTGFLILIELSFFIQCNQDYFGDFTFVSDRIQIPASVLPGILFFILAQLFVHLSYCVIIWLTAIAIFNVLPFSTKQKLTVGIVLWCYGVVTVLVANQYYFPNAHISVLNSVLFFNPNVTYYLLMFLFLGCALIVLLALMGVAKFSIENPVFCLFYLMIAILFSWILIKPTGQIIQDGASSEKPNIIIVGVDSLRPDFISYFGDDDITTPFLDAFLNSATVFTEAVTPLARTFPSWTSVLTGEYPRQSGVRYNLANQKTVDLSQTLPAILRSQGYETLYATDETRFSNIDTNYGFDKVVTPPMGLNDFLLGTFNDFPLSNLLINTQVGKWLFPYSYANRPVYFTYEPKSFLNLVTPEITLHRTKPLFFAIHFCLPHHPYLWAGLDGNNYSALERYNASIMRADRQLRDFFTLLKHTKLLEHAIVVLLSDHGEALELPGDRITEKDSFVPGRLHHLPVPKFYPPSLDNESVNQSAGHGTDVLGLPQYHSLLAFKLYGLGEQKSGAVAGVVSLLDIKPTILNLLKIEHPLSDAGNSLVAVITGHDGVPKHKHIFMESDFSPEAIHTVYPDTRKVVLEGIALFKIDPKTTRLLIKDQMGDMIVHSKQYADIYDDWMLALYPQTDHTRMPILINLNTGLWTNDLSSPFAQNSPAYGMLSALKSFYGNEIINLKTS